MDGKKGLSGVPVYENNQLLSHHSVTLTIKSHLEALETHE
jgi:hypothetical protein